MTLEKLIEMANEAYGDDLVRAYHDQPDENHGDTLAKFIVLELHDTFDPDATDAEQLAEAVRVMESGSRQLAHVAEHLGV